MNSEDDAITMSPIPTMGEQPEPLLNHLLDVMTKLLQSTLSKEQADKEAREEEKKKEQEESMTRRDTEVARRKQEERDRQAEWIIEKIPVMHRSDDIELFIQGVESELRQASYPQECWKAVLTSRLTLPMKELISDLQADPHSTFLHIKNWLLDCAGQTSTQASQELFDPRAKDMRGKSTAQAIQQLDRLMTRATKETRSKEDALARIVIAKARALLSVMGKQYFDSRRVQTLMDLRESLQSWEATEGVLFAQERLSRPTCFKCGKLGHRAADYVTLGLPPAMSHPRKMNAL